MPETNGSSFERVEYIPHHSPSESKTFAWYLANRSGGRPPEGLTNVPYSKVLTPRTTTPSDKPHTTIYSSFPREADSPFTGSQAVTATQEPGLFVFPRRRSEPFESFKPQPNRLDGFGYITLQTNDKQSLQKEISGYSTYIKATIGVYTAAYDPVLKKMGPYRLKKHTDMNVTVHRPQGAWAITVCEPDGDGDGKKTISKSGESINFCATVSRGDKGHYTNDGTLVFKDGLAWYGLKAVGKKKEDTSHMRDGDEARYCDENVGEKGQAKGPSGTKESEESKASFSEKDGGWCGGNEKPPDLSTKTRATTNWVRWFGGRPSNKRPPRSTKRQ